MHVKTTSGRSQPLRMRKHSCGYLGITRSIHGAMPSVHTHHSLTMAEDFDYVSTLYAGNNII